MKEQKEQNEKLRCPKCKSSFGYFRIKENEWVCRSCAEISKIEKEKDE